MSDAVVRTGNKMLKLKAGVKMVKSKQDLKNIQFVSLGIRWFRRKDE